MTGPDQAAGLFTAELDSRGVAWSRQSDGRYLIQLAGSQLSVGLENLDRELRADGDAARVPRFVDAVLAATREPAASADRLFWVLEPSDQAHPAPFRVPLSDRVDRVLATVAPDGSLITWLNSALLDGLSLTRTQAADAALTNLSAEATRAIVQYQEFHAVSDTPEGQRLAYLETDFVAKAALLLAPDLREVITPVLGWPVLAVAPDRGFVYLWSATHDAFTGRVGPVVVREFGSAPYPLSTELFRVDDDGVRAVGAWPAGTTD